MANSIKELLVIGVLVGVGGIGAAGYFIWSNGHPYMVIVNTTGGDKLDVFMDGDLLTSLPPSLESQSVSLFQERVSSGTHKLVAKNAAGEEVDSREVVIESGGDLWYYNPAPLGPAGLCLFKQTAEYGTSYAFGFGSGAPAPQLLGDAFGNFGDVDTWFEEPPDEVSVPEGSSTATRIAVRLRPCIDPGIY